MDFIFKAAETCHEPQGNKKLRSGNALPEEVSESLTPLPPPTSPADKLCEDELSLIFRNSCISPKDLLNFRGVSKSWRDAATGILLLRDACCVRVVLDTKIQNRVEKDVDFAYYRDKLNVGSDKDKKMMLTAFVKLAIVMKNSPKFPASNLCIDVSSSTSSTIFTAHLDLSLFFVHHRDKIKTICPRGWTTKKNLDDILFHLTPELECLDLSEATLNSFDSDNDDDDDNSNWDSKVLPLKSLILGKRIDPGFNHVHDILRLLLSTPSNLICIKEVNLLNLPLVLEERKGHLIRSFAITQSDPFDNVNDVTHLSTLLKQFSETNPKLWELTLELESSSHFYFVALPFINQMIKSSKDTLKALSISLKDTQFDFTGKIHIPPMLNLESITLDINFINPFDEIEIELNDGNNIFSFQDQVSGDQYFPSLVKVILKRQGGRIDSSIEPNLYCFFNEILKTEDVSSRNGSLSRVETLQLHDCNLPRETCYVNCLSDVFSNIRDLHIKFSLNLVTTTSGNSVSLWLQCPSVEFIEIYDIFIHEKHKKRDITSFLDVFFTGFSLGMCQKLRSQKLPHVMDNAEALDFLRITPSICDLEHLKELKMMFSSKFSMDFASHVTGAYAFMLMQNTKFVVSYNPVMWKLLQRIGYIQQGTDEDDSDTAPDDNHNTYENDSSVDVDELFLGSLKPYVIVVHDN